MFYKEHNTNKPINLTNNEYYVRQKKLKNMKKMGFNFPNNFKPNDSTKTVLPKYITLSHEKLNKLNSTVSIAGRIINLRIMGKSSFAILQDMYGSIQIYISIKKLTKNFYYQEFKTWDVGDIIGVKGKLFKTKTGELTIYCEYVKLLTKSLRPLPSKYYGLSNQEIRFRKRYLDFISNSKLFNIFKIRSKIVSIIRKFLLKKNFLEVETPMMHSMPGGAHAKPFTTYHNSLNTKLYLRIAPELYLKQLIVGGFEKIFEINRCFRNEGISSYHNPEFTMIEMYMAYKDYKDMILIIKDMFKYIYKKIIKMPTFNPHKNLSNYFQNFKYLTMINAILKYNERIKFNDLHDLQKIKKICHLLNISIENNLSIGEIQTKIFEKTTEKKLIRPTFITKYPIEVSPLARSNNIFPNLADRFELFINGLEIANGFSELNDSEEQKKRFLFQQNRKLKNSSSKNFNDEEYITALEYGLPPTAGLGLGIDRLIMLFTNSKSIRDVILFPTLKPFLKE